MKHIKPYQNLKNRKHCDHTPMHSCKARDLTMANIACTFYSNSTKGVKVAFASQSHKDIKFFPHLVGFWVKGKQNNPIWQFHLNNSMSFGIFLLDCTTQQGCH